MLSHEKKRNVLFLVCFSFLLVLHYTMSNAASVYSRLHPITVSAKYKWKLACKLIVTEGNAEFCILDIKTWSTKFLKLLMGRESYSEVKKCLNPAFFFFFSWSRQSIFNQLFTSLPFNAKRESDTSNWK